ncbi:MAG TPA: hypothetical protein VMH91_00195 [Candidatus Paceibacterota bacterium]|nr:hypothetical protein [Candidatus Paceibacterota bacterium]
MTLDTVIMAFGAFVAVLPFLQFPQDWTNFFAFVAGVVIIGLGVAVRRRGMHTASEGPTSFETRQDSFEDTSEE